MFLRGLGGRWGGQEENCQEVVPRGVMLADETGLFLPELHSLLGHSFQDRALPGGDLGLDTAHHFDRGVLTAELQEISTSGNEEPHVHLGVVLFIRLFCFLE